VKRILAALIITLSFFGTAGAQYFRAGLLAGVNITDVNGMDTKDFDNDFKKFGFIGGGYVNVHFNNKTMLQMEIAYSQKGSQIPPDTNIGTFNNNNYYTLKLSYITVDLALRRNIHINLGKNPTDKFSIEGGLSAGYLFHYYFQAQSIVYNLALNTSDFGAFAGFAYDFSDNFCIDLRYYNAITSIFSNEGSNSQWLYYGSWNRGHNLAFQITFKYTFGSSKQPETVKPPDASAPTVPKN